MKSFTDIERSIALQSILPIESADKVYIWSTTKKYLPLQPETQTTNQNAKSYARKIDTNHRVW